PLHHPEKESLGQLAIAIGNAARNVEEEEHHRVNRGLAPAGELTVPQVVVNESRGRAGRATALHHLLEGPPPIQARARAATVVTLADPFGFLRRTYTRLEVGKLHLFPKPVDNVVDFEFEQELHFAFILPARTFLTRPALLRRVGENVTGLRLAL